MPMPMPKSTQAHARMLATTVGYLKQAHSSARQTHSPTHMLLAHSSAASLALPGPDSPFEGAKHRRHVDRRAQKSLPRSESGAVRDFGFSASFSGVYMLANQGESGPFLSRDEELEFTFMFPVCILRSTSGA
ncbi:hypothetical protein BP5796_09981 [Coleophoma crateriformis]|uniref:Uncharacterized protein n=1 Tax=Coleophoma crateriformis TaxID=565419 RepID=A0A3D8QU21_9HELO|nr:hypothetical protein BP5796_09981 [Coleophoma crateriformis]